MRLVECDAGSGAIERARRKGKRKKMQATKQRAERESEREVDEETQTQAQLAYVHVVSLGPRLDCAVCALSCSYKQNVRRYFLGLGSSRAVRSLFSVRCLCIHVTVSLFSSLIVFFLSSLFVRWYELECVCLKLRRNWSFPNKIQSCCYVSC